MRNNRFKTGRNSLPLAMVATMLCGLLLEWSAKMNPHNAVVLGELRQAPLAHASHREHVV